MKLKNFSAGVFIIILSSLIRFDGNARSIADVPASTGQVSSAAVTFISAEDLKTRVSRNQPVTIIDVRASEAFAASDRKIKGAIHVKLRRLKYRLGFAPLKNVSHDSEIVTYCACPSDELAIQSAQILMDSGFKRVRVLKGGWHEWIKLKGPIEAASKTM